MSKLINRKGENCYDFSNFTVKDIEIFCYLSGAFLNNEASKRYFNRIMEIKPQNRKRNRGIYYEGHHILPDVMLGSGQDENMILFTAREHAEAHLDLLKFTTGENLSKMHFSIIKMIGNGNITLEEYEEIKEENSKIRSQKMKDLAAIGEHPSQDPEVKKKIGVNSSKCMTALASIGEHQFQKPEMIALTTARNERWLANGTHPLQRSDVIAENSNRMEKLSAEQVLAGTHIFQVENFRADHPNDAFSLYELTLLNGEIRFYLGVDKIIEEFGISRSQIMVLIRTQQPGKKGNWKGITFRKITRKNSKKELEKLSVKN